MKGETLHGEIIASALANRERTAFSYYSASSRRWESLKYGEFLEMAGAVSSRLILMGLRRGDRVCIIAENGPEWCAAYLGVLMAGSVAVPVDVRTTAEEIGNILADSDSRVAITGGEAAREASSACLRRGLRLIELGSMRWRPRRGFSGGSPEPAGGAGGDEEDTAALLYTSGTTGSPKAVVLTHGNFLSDARAIVDAGLLTERDNVLSVLPLHHTYAFMTTFVVPMLGGARVTYPAGLKGPEMVSAAVATGVTILVGVPQLLELMRDRIIKRIHERPAPLGWLMMRMIGLSGYLRRNADINLMGRLMKNPMGGQFRLIASGGARLDPAVMRDLEALGFTVLEGYGLTETSPVVALNPLRKRKPGSVGRPLPSVEIKVLDPSESGEGEIAIKGPMVMRGYYRKPAETEAAFRDGWLRSGDLGRIDDEGYVFITGRLKEIIVLPSGKNVYPEEVEKHYLRIPLIREICVTTYRGGLHAVVVPDLVRAKAEKVGNINESLKWLINSSSRGLPPHMRLTGYSLSAGPLPRTLLGKLRRFMVAERLEGMMGGKPAEGRVPSLGAPALDETGRAVARALESLAAEGTAISPSSNLELDLGLDSLKRVELLVSLERSLERCLPESLLAEVHTVGELIERLKESPPSAGVAGGPEEGLEELLSRSPSAEEMKRVGLGGRGLPWPVFPLLVLALRFPLKAVFRLRVAGLENLPPAPFIMAANHSSYIDGFVIGAVLPLRALRSLYFQGDRKIFNRRFFSRFARLAHVISIDPDASLGTALRLSAHVLRSGRELFIFPEGGRTFDGELMPFRKGVGILALRLGVPVVPVKIEGTYEVFPRHRRWPRPGRVVVTFGPPVFPPDVRAPDGTDPYQHFADEVRRRVQGLTARSQY
jgi:long-chain acyl-CoA synthetase